MQQRAVKTRQQILESAVRVFAEKGFSGATVDEIAEAAAVNKQRIYAYFGSKQGLFEAALLAFPGCAVVVSHDRMFLDRIATHILAWEGDDENPGRWHFFEGNFEAYQADREARLGKEAAKPHRLHRKLTRD